MGVRLSVLCCVLIVLVATPARADDFCAGTTGCPAGNSYPADGAGLQGALTAAQAHPGPDSVQIGPGRYESPFGFAYASADPVAVAGAGGGQTTLAAPCASPLFVMAGNVASALGAVTLEGGSGACRPAFSGAGRL